MPGLYVEHSHALDTPAVVVNVIAANRCFACASNFTYFSIFLSAADRLSLDVGFTFEIVGLVGVTVVTVEQPVDPGGTCGAYGQ